MRLLSELPTGESAIIVKVQGYGAFRKRVMEMGFVPGQRITAVLSAPLKDPVKYRLMDYEVLLRRSEASMIEVEPLNPRLHDADGDEHEEKTDTSAFHHEDSTIADNVSDHIRTIDVALIGNPNCGKTSLFNIASGANEHVGNYSGVTVDFKTGTFTYKNYRFNLVDLPGTYSLSAYSPEELYVRRYLRNNTPDIIVNVVDASNLERNLYLTTELIDMDRSMVIALNMYDELQATGDSIDYKQLGEMIGVPIVPTVSRTGEGINRLFDEVIAVYEGKHSSVRHIHVNLGKEIEPAVNALKDIIKRDETIEKKFSPRYLAIKYLEKDTEATEVLKDIPCYKELEEERDRQTARFEATHQEDVTSVITAEKYGFISGALAEVLTRSTRAIATTTSIIDMFVTNKLFGFPLFALIMLAMFWVTFTVGAYPQEWIEWGVEKIASLVATYMPNGPLKDLITQGVIGGVGSVIVFLPNILILYFFISFMEDSGYMARAAFIMDRIMHKIGLHGKSFIPLVMGFGCNVPAIMASRSIESRSSRLITILINPFMSCTARLPIYVLLIGTFFEAHAALVFFCLYVTGVAVAVITAKMLRKFFYKQDETPFVMELPPYRIPTMKTAMRHMWWKGKQYLQKMGGIILVGSIVIWALNYFPLHSNDSSTPEAVAERETEDIAATAGSDSAINFAEDSYLEMLGKAINPVMAPIGMSWRATVAVIAGIPAKEIVVSTLGVLYTGDDEVEDSTLGAKLTSPNPITGKPDFTAASALAFMIFVLLYCPCLATVVAIIKETGDWRYGLFAVVYNTAVAWLVAFVVYRVGMLF